LSHKIIIIITITITIIIIFIVIIIDSNNNITIIIIILVIIIFIIIHSFILAISSPLLFRGAPDYSTDTVSEFHAEAYRQL